MNNLDYFNKYPIAWSSLILTIFLNFNKLFETSIYYLIGSFLILYLFLSFLESIYKKLFEGYNSEIKYKLNKSNILLGIFLIFITNGYFIFSDILNYRIKLRTKEIPFLNKNYFDKMIRVGIKTEADIRLIIIYVFVLITSIIYVLNGIYDLFLFDLLYRISFFSLLNSVIPYSSIFAIIDVSRWVKSNSILGPERSKLKLIYPESGAMRIFLGSRRRYIFTLLFIFSFISLINFNLDIYDTYLTASILALIIFSIYLVKVEFDSIKKSVVK